MTDQKFEYSTCPDCGETIANLGHECGAWEDTIGSGNHSRRNIKCGRCDTPIGIMYGPKGSLIHGWYYCKDCAKAVIEKRDAGRHEDTRSGMVS